MRKTYLVVSVVWAIFIGITSLIPASGFPSLRLSLALPTDKIVHFVFYFVLTFLLLQVFKPNLKQNSNKLALKLLLTLIIVFFYGSLIELIQLLTFVHRKSDVLDVITNIAGELSGFVFFIILNFNLLKQKL
ncbi:MAG: VanZ family protein [Bacteroidota bacterium]|nr:VanZ family protein [Bacteroidota bacterium]